MPRCRVDPELTRTVSEAGSGQAAFAFPLGVYPIEPMTPRPGYSVEFEPADAGESGQFEEWPDRYLFDIVISAERLEPLCRSLFGLLPGRIYPILDYLGHDQFREVDPYISYDLIGTDRLLDAIRRYRGFFFEDGLCGFGAMVDDPFLYIFVDEHKVVTVRCEPERREKVERILQAFDLDHLPAAGIVEGAATSSAPPAADATSDPAGLAGAAGAASQPAFLPVGPAGADAAAHEHRSVLSTADDRPDLLTADEIVEDLRDEWNLVLNVDPETNLDEEGNDLGITPWRCLVRVSAEEPLRSGGSADSSPSESAQPTNDNAPRTRYADVILAASCLRAAEQLALDAADDLAPDDEIWDEATVVFADRIQPEMFQEFLRTHGEDATPENSLPDERIIWTGWLE